MTTDWTKGAAWMKGAVIPIDQAAIGVTDWGVTRSDITYDVVSVNNGAFFRLGDYLDRFQNSMAELRMDVGLTRYDIRNAVMAMVAQSGLRDAYCAMVASRGAPLIPGTRDPRHCGNHFYAWCVPYVHVFTPEMVARGARLKIAETATRIGENSVNPRVKNYHWGDLTRGLFEAKDAGFDSAVLLDEAGNVTEGPGFNIFAIKGDTLTTSDHGVLHGVTRKTVMELAAAQGMTVETRALPAEELLNADEVFLSTTAGGLTPVARVDDRIFSNDAPGPVSLRLAGSYAQALADPAYCTPVPYENAAI